MVICLAEAPETSDELETELDEMWSYVGKKSALRWLWHAIDHHTGSRVGLRIGGS